MVIYDLNDLKEIIPDGTIVGQHGLHSHIHQGHLELARVAKDRCNFTIGMYYANFARMIEAFCGHTVKQDDGPLPEDIATLEMLHDVVMVFQGDYIPFEAGLWDRCVSEYPDARLEQLGVLETEAQLQSFRTSQAIVHALNRFIRYDYNYCGSKDAWRVPYLQWYDEAYPGKLILVDCLRDRYGNCISGGIESLPYAEKSKINKRLLLPNFRTKDEVVVHVSDIDGLEVISFHNMADVTGRIHARFGLAGHQWNDGCAIA